MAPLPLRERMVRLRKAVDRELKPMDRARLLKQILQCYESIQTWDECEQDAPLLARHVWPAGEGVAIGGNAHRSATFDGMTTAQAEAVRAYSADGENGQYQKINGYFRAVSNGDTPPPLPWREQRTTDELDEMFRRTDGLKEPTRVYRGLSSANLAVRTTKTKKYQDAGFSSTSSELLPAMVYSGEAKMIFVIELPAGYKAVSIEKISRNPHEKEILLPRDAMFEVFDEPKEYNGFTLLHMRPANDRLSD